MERCDEEKKRYLKEERKTKAWRKIRETQVS
jgi:hypothetical protein